MQIKVLASGSKGNCYWVSDGITPLLIECGIPFKALQKALDFNTFKIKGCLISHEHGDHSRSAADLVRMGIDVYASTGTIEAIKVAGILPIIANPFTIRSWIIYPFPIEHDAAEPFGFVLQSGSERLLYLTDTPYSHYRFSGLTHLMLECNYSLDLLKDNVLSGEVDRAVKSRVLRSHMGLETLIEMLKANDLSQVVEIWLLHLSDSNSDAEMFKKRVQEATGKIVKVA